jgi:hypothetical protein
MTWDIIGDIHGCADSLQALLNKLGYVASNGVYRHPARKVAFLGDFIDRGPDQRGVLDTVRAMIDAGSAVAVMGNHEFNAIAYLTEADGSAGHLREHSAKNQRQHRAFLDAFASHPDEYREVIDWFKTLPLWLELEGFRVVHACWDPRWIAQLNAQHEGDRLTDDLLHTASQPDTWEFEAVETLLKGKEVPLPTGVGFRDKDGNERHHIRVRWWDRDARTYREAFMGPSSALSHIPDDDIDGDHLLDYGPDERPVFLGHYWLEGEPAPLTNNVACLDYSVAKPGGKLVAYRWDGESTLLPERFVWVERVEREEV